MIPSEKIVELLERHIEKLKKLSGEELGGYAVIFSPDTGVPPLEIMLLDTLSDDKSFLSLVKDKLSVARAEANVFGAVNTSSAKRPWA